MNLRTLEALWEPREDTWPTIGFTAEPATPARAEERWQTIEGMLAWRAMGVPEPSCEEQSYGNLAALNRGGLIARSIDPETLRGIANEYLLLLHTWTAIYEKNGDYALGLFASDWCRIMDRASRQLCHTDDNAAALASGQWLCHEAHWTNCGKQAMATRQAVDGACRGGLCIYAVPIVAGGAVIGAISFGYGAPPKDPAQVEALARAYGLTQDELVCAAQAYAARPTFLVELAKQRLAVSAGLIGLLVERQQAWEALQQKQEWLNEMGHMAHVGGWVADVTTGAQQWTNEMFAIHELELAAGPPPVEKGWQYYAPVARPALEAAWKRAVEHGEPFDLELPFVTAKGSSRWVRTMAKPCRQQGSVVSLTGTFQDITRLKHKEDEVRLRQAEKLASLGQLAGGIAHNFNNQLSAVLGFADMLQISVADAQSRRYAAQIIKAAHRCADLTAQLLAFARKGKYCSQPVDLHGLIAETLALLEPTLDKRITIQREFLAEPATVFGDPKQLQNMLMHLTLNARDAMPAGGQIRFATASVQLADAQAAALEVEPGLYVRLTVADAGLGMTPEVQRHLFEPFFTTKEVGQGVGLGLASVHGTVTNHHGAVTVQSEPGQGSTFTIHLPQQVERVSTAKPAENGVALAAKTNAHILLVDDEEIILEMGRAILQNLGYTVTTCTNGADAVELYREHRQTVALVILDVVMPRLGGRAAYRALRAINPAVKVLVSSGYSIDSEVREILNEGAQAFLQKPFSRAELSRKVAETLG